MLAAQYSLEVGKTYLVHSTSSTEPLLISQFDWLNIPSTHPKYSGYLQDLEKAEVRPMYVEAEAMTFDTQNNRVIVRGRVTIYRDRSMLLAEQVIDDRNVNELVAEGKVLLRNPDGSMTRGDRLRLPDDYRDTFPARLDPARHGSSTELGCVDRLSQPRPTPFRLGPLLGWLGFANRQKNDELYDFLIGTTRSSR